MFIHFGARGKEKNISWFPYVPWPGIEPTTFRYTGRYFNQLSHWPGPNLFVFQSMTSPFFIFKREGEKEREKSICCSTYLCICWLLLACVLTRDWTHNLGVSWQWCNQLSHPARTQILISTSYFLGLFLKTHLNCPHHGSTLVPLTVQVVFGIKVPFDVIKDSRHFPIHVKLHSFML